MAILTLTTDWGLRDHYLAAFKGELLVSIPSIQLIDISHDIERFNIMQTAFIIQNSYQKFPKGTIHFIGVSWNENNPIRNPFVIIRANGHYLLGEDNGIFTLILSNDEKEIIRLPLNIQNSRNEIHHELLFTIKKLAEGKFSDLGSPDTTLKESYFALPTIDPDVIQGTIIYVDSFGNAVVNITRELFLSKILNRNFIIHLRKSTYDISTISKSYEDVEVGEILALFNQDGFLEIALNKESASQLLGLKLMDPIRIEFYDSQVV